MTAYRDARGVFRRLPHDPANAWVLFDQRLHEAVIRVPTRDKCREWRRCAGGYVVRTKGDG